MSDRMIPIPFGNLMDWILEESEKGSIFGIRRLFYADSGHVSRIFGRSLETPFGPAAGPHTQLAQNIIAAYAAGGRFFELKTVQKLDGPDLPVSKPCILAEDEGYNCEWSTELYVSQAFDEYVKAWFACKVLAVELGLGGMDGFQFNMSVGYDLEGIKTEKIDRFIEGMKDASRTPIFEECRQWLLEHLDRFRRLTGEEVERISPHICDSVTLSTLHGCPPQEIERIAVYLLEEKKLHTFIKCNPTLLGYETARRRMDEMGYDQVAFGDFHFRDDLQYEDAVPMLRRLQALADREGLEFGVKLTNTFPVDVTQNELPSEEMYMSGKPLYALSMSVASMLAEEFGGKLRISYSGGADALNIEEIVDAGIWPVTMATTLLKPGGYQRLEQIAKLFSQKEPPVFCGVNAAGVRRIAEAAAKHPRYRKALKPLPSRKNGRPVPLTDCFIAPCQEGCPIHQDITEYLRLADLGDWAGALKVILDKNPLPFMTGTICSHRCTSRCTRNFYESPVTIREVKLKCAERGFDEVISGLKASESDAGGRAAVVGGGPAGLAAAFFLARGGMKVTLFEKETEPGGLTRYVIPEFRISREAVDRDIALIRAMGVEILTGREITSVKELRRDYDAVILALGARTPGELKLEAGNAVNALEFLEEFYKTNGTVRLGKQVVVIGGGNTAMDTARAAKRNEGVEKVSLVYRRTKRYMPADEEELEAALADGVEFAELLSPIRHENGLLSCRRMKLGEIGSDGRRSVTETEELVNIPADTVIAAVGEKPPGEFYRKNGIEPDRAGRPIVNRETLETSLDGVYAVGDGLFGPATIVEGIRDGRMAAEAIVGKTLTKVSFARPETETGSSKKGRLEEAGEDSRCLSCNLCCENCVEVCPNRANLALSVPGMEKRQILHVDALCNECGNCRSFCPWDSAPYRDKFTLFREEEELKESGRQGFAVTDRETGTCAVCLGGRRLEYRTGTENEYIPKEIRSLIDTVLRDYRYIL